jgi:hypothetical protein
LRRRKKRRALEPDRCYWIASESAMRGKRHFDARTDPPPDLAIEVDVTDACIPYLQALPKLRFVELDNTAITPEGFKKLQEAIPGLTIQGGPGGASGKPNGAKGDQENKK